MDGTTVFNRCMSERTMHTKNEYVNERSIAIALAGNFNNYPPTAVQLKVLKQKIQELNRIYKFEHIITHKDASPTGCAGKHLNEWVATVFEGWQPPKQKVFKLSRYYTPVRNQSHYFRKYDGERLFYEAIEHKVIAKENGRFVYHSEGEIIPRVLGKTISAAVQSFENGGVTIDTIKKETEYRADFEVNCMGDCLSTASTYRLSNKDAYRIVACPKGYPFKTKFIVNGTTFTCWDRGGAITENGDTIRLDIWSGIGIDGLNKIRNTSVPHNPVVEVVLP